MEALPSQALLRPCCGGGCGLTDFAASVIMGPAPRPSHTDCQGEGSDAGRNDKAMNDETIYPPPPL